MISMMIAMLASLGSGRPQEPPSVPVYLNHFFLVLDAETYAAIEAHPFLRREFAPNESRTTRRSDISYTGLYFYGINTYFEFFNAATETRRKVGDSGIAFGVENAGAIRGLQERLQGSTNLITRPLGDRQVSWFYSLAPKNFSFVSGMSSWIMEYHPRFLADWNPQPGDRNDGISRRRALERYVSVLKEHPSRPVFQEVRAITLAVESTTLAGLAEMCRAFGYASRSDGSDEVFDGPDFQLRLLPETASRRGIRQVTLRVSRLPEQKVYRFGKTSVLTFNLDNTATWTF